MATVYLGRSDSEFWAMLPRTLITLIDEWKEIEKNRYRLSGFIANGGNPDEVEKVQKTDDGWNYL